MSVSSGDHNGFFAEFLDDFFAECDEHLTIIRRNLLAIEAFTGQERIPQPVLDELFRSFHSLKGLAGMVGAQALEQVTHEVENYLRLLRLGLARLTHAGLDALVAATGASEQAIVAFKDQAPAIDVGAVVEHLSALGTEAATPDRIEPRPSDRTVAVSLTPDERVQIEAASAEQIPLWVFHFHPSAALAERGINVTIIRERLQGLGTIVRAAPTVLPGGSITFEFVVATSAAEDQFVGWHDDGLEHQPYLAEPASDDQAPAIATSVAEAPPLQAVTPTNIVRVDLTRLDELMQLIGELVITRSRLDNRLLRLEQAVTVQEWRELLDVNRLLERQLRTLRSAVTRTRMVPIGDVFARMQFAIRDLARDGGQHVRLDLSGHETAIDKFVVDRITDPLLHLVRNAISHGLEPPAERLAAGKPAEGTIALRASTTGDEVAIEIEDDGRGVDATAVAARARRLGLLDATTRPDEEQLLDILCAPGFSTRDTADRASGRGVGMAVVQKTVQQLGGRLRLQTRPGQGSRFTIHLPLTLLIVDALIVDVGCQRFAMPLSAVSELIDVQELTPVAFENNLLVNIRGKILSLIHLAQRFGSREPGLQRYAMVVGDERSMAGLVIDRLIGKHEIVVRPLADPLVDVDGFSGATELGDGRAVLILDASALVRGPATSMQLLARAETPDRWEGGHVLKHTETQSESAPFILFDLAGTTYGIASEQVQRIELIEEVTPVPNAHPALDGIVFSRGQLIPVLSLRARFGLPKLPYSIRTRLIIVNVEDRTVGLLVDTAREFVIIPSGAIQSPPETIGNLSGKYLRQIATLGERLVLLLDLGAVLDLADLMEVMTQEPEKGEA